MVRYISPVLARWKTPEKYNSRRRRDGKRLEKLERYVSVLGKFHKKYQQSQPGPVYEEGLPTRPNTPIQGSGPPSPLPTPIALSYDDLPASSSKSTNPPANKLSKLKAKVLRYLRRAQKMAVLARLASATSSNKPYLTPHTPLSTHPRALIDMTPLPSLFDRMIEVAKRNKRSTPVQSDSKVGGDLVLSPIPEESERPSSAPVEGRGVQQPSDVPTEVEVEPEPVAHQPSATSDHMDFEDAPIVFSVPDDPTPPPLPFVSPPAPTLISPLAHGEVVTNFPPPNPLYIHPEPPLAPPPTNYDPLLSELTNSATFPHPTTYYNPPSTSANFGSQFTPHREVLFEPLQVDEEPLRTQIPGRDVEYPRYSTFPLHTYPTAPPILYASAPVQNAMQPADLPVLAQSLPAFTPISAYPCLNPQREEPEWLHLPPPSAPVKSSYRRPTFVPQAQQRPELENSFAWWFHPCPRTPSWRIRELERQREMDRIAEPYIARLREVSRQKVEAEARARAGQQKADRTKEEPEKASRYSLRENEKKAQKELKEFERQQRSEAKRQARRDSREERRRRKSAENIPPEDQEVGVSVSPRRKSSGRPKPYSIPHPARRSPRRSHTMPGGFDFDGLTSDHSGAVSGALWKGLTSAVDVGFRLWV